MGQPLIMTETAGEARATAPEEVVEAQVTQLYAWLAPEARGHTLILGTEDQGTAQILRRLAPSAQIETAAQVDGLAEGAAAAYDLIVCWHVPELRILTEAKLVELIRLLRPGGRLAVVALAAPGSRLRGKRGRQWRNAGIYFNAMLSLRNGRLTTAFSTDEWQHALLAAGLVIEQLALYSRQVDLRSWSGDLAPLDRTRLEAMVHQAPEKVQEFLTPQFGNARIDLCLHELILVARLETAD